MRLTRAGVAGVAALVGVGLVLGGCADRSEPEPDAVDEVLQPTGAPSSLTPRDASGERTSPDGAWSIVLPDGAVEQREDSATEGVEGVSYRMPDESEVGLPGVTVKWSADVPVDALAESSGLETTLEVNPNVSDLVRSEIDWPGAEVAVVVTWSEEVEMQTGDWIQVDTVLLMLEGPDGPLVSARAYGLAGEVEGSTAWEALRTVRLGQG